MSHPNSKLVVSLSTADVTALVADRIVREILTLRAERAELLGYRFPGKGESKATAEEVEEERRLMYVAVTRARRRLR